MAKQSGAMAGGDNTVGRYAGRGRISDESSKERYQGVEGHEGE